MSDSTAALSLTAFTIIGCGLDNDRSLFRRRLFSALCVSNLL